MTDFAAGGPEFENQTLYKTFDEDGWERDTIYEDGPRRVHSCCCCREHKEIWARIVFEPEGYGWMCKDCAGAHVFSRWPVVDAATDEVGNAPTPMVKIAGAGRYRKDKGG